MPYKDKNGKFCGFLNAEEKEGSGKFLRRYFLLDEKKSRLYYYKDNPGNLHADYSKTCGEIEIHFISRVSDARKLRPKVDNCFSITYAGRTIYLEAEDEDDLLGWIKALNDASKITVPVKNEDLGNGKKETKAGFTAEIAGGVVCKIPMKVSDEEPGSSDESPNESSGLSASTLPSYISGYCVKQGGMRKNWKRRYFVFSENGFQYYSSDRAKEPLRTLPKADIIDVRRSLSGHSSRDNLFEVVTAKRTFYIQCDDPADTDKWVNMMKQNLPTTQISLTQSLRRPPTNSQEMAVTRVFPSKEWRPESPQRSSSQIDENQQKKRSWLLW
ncbi:Pleckstrin homology domain-containing family A member 1,Pleckstrin homology domain-containing family A member 2 [Mytilus coruscus]|uniref:Pleckstrin homology domain-containing family A member 1,Pleckstrin homology domain-containing family A member 2 n=1 Tax=Mytilus coruscus TaxID=42192 RepID=A0A6J8B1L1_MYTCO|nr:Pleckstrin homology domain-containing family A member 1,Pleckstrin homology domain-containing family A member 2 [Mytilus coruscus]